MSGYNLKGLEALRDSVARYGDLFSVELIAMAMTFLTFHPRERRMLEEAYSLRGGEVPHRSDRVTVASMTLGIEYRVVQRGLDRAVLRLHEVCLLIASDPQEFMPGQTDPRLVPLAALPLNDRVLNPLESSQLSTLADLLALELDTPEGVERLLGLFGIGPASLRKINKALVKADQAPLAGFESRKKN